MLIKNLQKKKKQNTLFCLAFIFYCNFSTVGNWEQTLVAVTET